MSRAKGKTPEDTTRVSRKAADQKLPQDKIISLTATEGPLKGKAFSIMKPRVSLGRSPANDVVVDDPDVSRVHCVVEIRGAAGVLVDLNSSNGTYVDEKKVQTFQLEHLSEFRIGKTTLDVHRERQARVGLGGRPRLSCRLPARINLTPRLAGAYKRLGRWPTPTETINHEIE